VLADVFGKGRIAAAPKPTAYYEIASIGRGGIHRQSSEGRVSEGKGQSGKRAA